MITGVFSAGFSSSLSKNNGWLSKFSGGSVYDGKILQNPNDASTFYLVTRQIEIRKFSIKTGLPITTYTYSIGLSIHDAIIDSSGNMYISGSSGTTIYVFKINSSMSIVWQKTISNSYVPYSEGAMRLDSSGNLYVTYYEGVDYSNYYSSLAKFDSNGNFQWNRTMTSYYPTTSMQPIVIDQYGYIYVAGYYKGASSSIAAVVKIDQNGNHQWTTSIDNSSVWDAFLNEIQIDSTGNVYAFGFSDNDGRRALIAKITPSGSVSWQKTIGGISGEWVGPGSFVISEDSLYLNMFGPVVSGANVATIIKLNSSGVKQYERHLQFPGQGIYTQSIGVVGSHFYMPGYSPFGFIFKAPKDGSKTGIYNSFGIAVSYNPPVAPSTEAWTSYSVFSGGISVSSSSKTIGTPAGAISEQASYTSAISRRF